VWLVAAAARAVLFSKAFGKLRRRMASFSDTRIRLISQIVSGIRVVKLLHWEPPYARWVHEARRRCVTALCVPSMS
jgi:hypothetical protein